MRLGEQQFFLETVGFTAMGDRRLQTLSDFRRTVRQVRLHETHARRQSQYLWLERCRIYGVDVSAKRNALPADTLSRLKTAYLDRGGQRDNAAYGWVRKDV
jgi:hypothetical protein